MLPSSRTALRVVAWYVVVGVAGILLSDVLASSVASDPEAHLLAHLLLLVVVVAVTAAVLFVALRRQFRQLAAAEAARVASETRFAGLVAVLPQAVLASDDEGRIVFVNRRAEALFGRAATDVVGRPVTSLVAPSSADAFRRHLRETGDAFEPDRARRIDLAARHRDGSEFRVLVRSGRLRRHHRPLYVTFVDTLEPRGPVPAPAATAGARPQTVADCMSRDPKTVTPDDDAWTALAIMRAERIRHLVVASGGRLVGVLSNRDYRAILNRVRPDGSIASVAATVREIMTDEERLVTVRAETSLTDAAALIIGRGIGCLPVVEPGGRIVGIVTQADLLRVALGGGGGAAP